LGTDPLGLGWLSACVRGRGVFAGGMGFFDLLKAKKAAAQSTPLQSTPAAEVTQSPSSTVGGGEVPKRLLQGRELLEAKNLEAAMAVYEELLNEYGDRADVLVSVSGDLGVHGHLQEIIEHIAPRYDATRHGPATGINVLQAYLALRNIEAAQHVLGILFSLNRPDLEERLHGFSNVIAELIEQSRQGNQVDGLNSGGGEMAAQPMHVNLVTISKPIWFYGLEEMAAEILPPKSGKCRRVAFAQLALLGLEDPAAKLRQPEDGLTRLTRAIPLWLAETLFFCPHYQAIAVLGMMDNPELGKHYALFGSEWTAEHLRQVIQTNKEPLDYIFTGAIREKAGDTELLLRLWEVKGFRERKQIVVRWTPATEEAELRRFIDSFKLFMEHKVYPSGQGVAYSPTLPPSAWLDSLGASATLFLAEKGVISPSQVSQPEADLKHATERARSGVLESLSLLTLSRRLQALNLGSGCSPEGTLFEDPLVARAKALC